MRFCTFLLSAAFLPRGVFSCSSSDRSVCKVEPCLQTRKACSSAGYSEEWTNCEEMCKATQGCKLWLFGAKDNECWLKDSYKYTYTPYNNEGPYWAGGELVEGGEIVKDKRYAFGDLKAEKWQACQNWCRGFVKCHTWSWWGKHDRCIFYFSKCTTYYLDYDIATGAQCRPAPSYRPTGEPTTPTAYPTGPPPTPWPTEARPTYKPTVHPTGAQPTLWPTGVKPTRWPTEAAGTLRPDTLKPTTDVKQDDTDRWEGSFANLKTWCKSFVDTKPECMGTCAGKFKKGVCLSPTSPAKIKCKKLKREASCRSAMCEAKAKKGVYRKCGGKSKLGE